ncbi:hypothetical protein K439DRAFT_529155 [Ramaria rubella]|nr:hypothetical protein K439DRAFT_529155 [Ramaria rubella]
MRWLSKGHPASPIDAPDNALPRFINRGSRRSIGSASSTGSFNSGTESHTWQPLDDLFTVKAVYNECVIVFRARYNMSFLALRQTIKDRLALQDCIPFHDFCLAYIPSQTSTANNGGVRRSNSVSSATSDLSHPRLLRTEADWQAAMLLNNGKVSLRVLDPETS